MHDTPKVEIVNSFIRKIMNSFVEIESSQFKLCSFNDFTEQNPALGYSLGFSHEHGNISIYFFQGEQFPTSDEKIIYYQLQGLVDLCHIYPEKMNEIQSAKLDLMEMDENIKYYCSSLNIYDIDEIIMSTELLGINVKIRCSIINGQKEALHTFLDKFFEVVKKTEKQFNDFVKNN